MDTFEQHVVYSKELFGFKNIDDFVKDVLLDIFKRAEVLVKKETPVNLLSDLLDKRSTLRSAYVIVYGWVRGKHACVNLVKVLPLVGLGVDAFIIGHTSLKVASSKVVKHEKACSHNQHAFIPFTFDTFVFPTPEVVDLLHRVQRIMHSNVMSP